MMKLKGVVDCLNKNSATNRFDSEYDGKQVLVLGAGVRDGYSSTEDCLYCALEENGKTKIRSFSSCNITITDKLF